MSHVTKVTEINYGIETTLRIDNASIDNQGYVFGDHIPPDTAQYPDCNEIAILMRKVRQFRRVHFVNCIISSMDDLIFKNCVFTTCTNVVEHCILSMNRCATYGYWICSHYDVDPEKIIACSVIEQGHVYHDMYIHFRHKYTQQIDYESLILNELGFLIVRDNRDVIILA